MIEIICEIAASKSKNIFEMLKSKALFQKVAARMFQSQDNNEHKKKGNSLYTKYSKNKEEVSEKIRMKLLQIQFA